MLTEKSRWQQRFGGASAPGVQVASRTLGRGHLAGQAPCGHRHMAFLSSGLCSSRRREPTAPEKAAPAPAWPRGCPPTRKNILCCRPFLVSVCRQPSRMNSCKTVTRSLAVGPGHAARGSWQAGWRHRHRLHFSGPLCRSPWQAPPRGPHALCALYPPPSCLLLPAGQGLAGCQ